MCLTVKQSAARKHADEDIYVYKVLHKRKGLYKHWVNHGDTFKGVILGYGSGVECEGKISVYYGDYYFCTNHDKLDGSRCDERFGYKYSWIMADTVKSIIANDKECVIEGYQTLFRHYPVLMGETYTSNLDNIRDNKVEVGLHSFAALNDAEDACIGADCYIAECIIPEGSSYYVGTFDGVTSYASDKLKYNKICVLASQ